MKIRFYYLPDIDTIDLWLDDPEKEELSEPLGENMILKYDGEGRIIGMEIISLEKLTSKDVEKTTKANKGSTKKDTRKNIYKNRANNLVIII